MTRITIPQNIVEQVRAATGPIDLVDEKGVTILKGVIPFYEGCPFTEEEAERILREEPTRSLAEIWKTLGVK